MSFSGTPPPQPLPRNLPQMWHGHESKSDDESSVLNVNRNIPKTAQTRLRKSGGAAVSSSTRRFTEVKNLNVHQQQNIDPATYIDSQEAYLKRDPMMKKFYGFIRSKLNSLFISLFASDGGFVEKSVPTHLATKIFQGAASIVPEPALAAGANVAAKISQVYHNQEHSNRVEKAVEVCLDPYLATEYARRTAIRLCEIYEDQIKELKEEGPERLARFAITACHDFLEGNALVIDQPIPEQLVKAIQEKGAEKRSIPTKISTKAAQKAERYKPSKKIVNFFRFTHLELPTKKKYFFEGKKKDWKADKLFSRCGIRVREGDQWVYYGNDNGQDNGDTGERYTRTELYGFRVGTEKEAKYFGMKELKRGTHPSRFPETIIDLPLSREKSNRGYLMGVWEAFAENCVQEMAEQNEYLFQHGGDIEQIRQEQEELRGFIKRVIAFLEQLTQELAEQGKNLSQNSESLEAMRKEQEELRDLIVEISKFSARQEEQLSQNSAALQVMHEEQRKLEEHLETLRSFSENCTQTMKKQDEYLSQHSSALERIQEGQKELPKLVEDLNSFSKNFGRVTARQDEHLSQHSVALSEILETASILSDNLNRAMEKHRTDQSQNSESLERIQAELGKLPDLVNAMKTFSENCMQAMEKQEFSMQEEMRKISTAIEKLVRDKHPSIPQRDVNNVQQGLQTFYSLKKNFQLAFSGRTLEIKESFVQLAIIEEVRERKNEEARQGEQENGERKKEGEQLRETMLETCETVHAIKKPIALETLFDLEHRKFLLLGQAGVGKSTLCQKIAHMWATEGFWRNRFSYLFWVPLRNLTEKRYPHGKQYLENILARECFSKKGEEEKLHLIEDIKEILNNHSDEVLMILDGYDETTQMPDAIHEELFARARDLGSCMIVTSRPFATEIEEIKREMDATLENMGFTEEHTREYIANYFEQDQSKSTHLNDFIKQRRDLATMAQTPLLLEMLCLLWEEGEKEGEQLTDLTMTELYRKVVKEGFRGYFLRQKAQARLLQRKYIAKFEKQKQQERERLSLALGKVALEGLKIGQFLIDGRLIENSLSGLNIVAEEFYLNGFLNPVEGDDREWKPGYFMHPTIQEYFAAFYLATKESEAKKTMTTYKYEPHMQLVWTMCAGLLGSKNFGDVGEEGEVSDEICCQRVCAFFAALHDEPRDLIGRYHNRLAVACLNACPDRGNLYSQIEKRYKTLSFLKGFIQLALRKPLDLSLEFRSPSVMKYCLMEVIKGLGGWYGDVRGAAVKALGEIKDPAAVVPLIERLGGWNWCVRWVAARALGEIKDPAAVVPLIERLGDKDEDTFVRVAAAEALGEIKDPVAVAALIKKLGDEYVYVRRVAAEALGKVKDPAAVVPLIEMLGDKSGGVRLSAAEALGEIKDPAAVLALIERLGDWNEDVREAAAYALGKIKDVAAVRLLIERLGDWNEDVREAAAYALGKIKDVAAVRLLIERLGDKDENSDVRKAAAEALGEIKDPAAVVPLMERLGDWNGGVRKAAAEALGEIKDPAAVVALIKSLGDEYVHVRRAAARALGEIKDPDAVVALIERLGDKDEDEYVRKAAAYALDEIKDPAAVVPLIERLGDKDEDTFVRRAAAEALGEIKDPAAVVALIQRLGDENEYVRVAAAKALGEIKDSAAVVPLIERLGDEYVSVREAAAEALEKMEYKSLLTSALNSNQTKVLAVVVKRALLNNHPLFLCRSEQNEYNLKCGREQMLISEREKTWIKKGLNRALSKELGSYGCIIL